MSGNVPNRRAAAPGHAHRPHASALRVNVLAGEEIGVTRGGVAPVWANWGAARG